MPHGLDTDSRIRFYEHEFYALSNFSSFMLFWNGHDWMTSEHAYHSEKFTDPAVLEELKQARSAHAAMQIARKHADKVRPDWDAIKLEVMKRILQAKVEQHEYVRRKLLQTGDRVLVEDSWRDDFWGWGPNRDGANHLGRLWMQVRTEIRIENRKDIEEK